MNLFALSPVLLLVAILPRETPFGAAQPAPAQPTETRRAELSERATPLAEPDPGSGETLTLPDPTWKFSEIFTFDLGDHFCENNLAIADFDGDGDNDIAVLATRYSPGAWARKLVILHQGPDWTFTETLLAEYDNYGYAVAAGDLDGNETADLVVRAWPGTRVYLSDGRGGFRESWSGPGGYATLAVADLDGDGFRDLILDHSNWEGRSTLNTLRNAGAGTAFHETWSADVTYGVQSIRTTALDAEPAPDLAEVEIYSGILRTFLNDGTGGSFRTGQVIGLGDRTFSLAAGNIDGDALGDLATHVGWGQVRVYSSDGEGGLRTYWTSPHLGQAAFNLELSDFDRDGDDDLFVGTFGDGELRIFENRLGEISSEPFGLAWTGRVPGEGYSGTAADIDGDGAPDLIVGDLNGLRVLRNETEPPAHPFAWFEIELLDLQLSPRRGAHDRFTVAGTFVLGERSGQLDPPDEALTIAVGSVELSIPAGSFEWREGGFAFEGWVGTVSVVAYLQENGPGTYAFAVRAGPVDLRGAGEPESVKLRVGNDRGAATVRLGGRLRHGDGRTSLPGRMGAP